MIEEFCSPHMFSTDQLPYYFTSLAGGFQSYYTVVAGSGGDGPHLAIKRSGGTVYEARRALKAARGSLIVAARVKFDLLPASNNPFLYLLDNATIQVQLRAMSDGALRVIAGGSATAEVILGTSPPGLITAGGWNYVEFYADIKTGTAGSVKVRLNNILIPELNITGVNTATSTVAQVTQWSFVGQGSTGQASSDVRFRDWVVINQVAGGATDFLGDVRVEYKAPVGDGFWKDWPPSAGASHFAMVDEVPAVLTDYVSAAVVGARDSYNFADVVAEPGIPIHAVALMALMDKSDAGAAAAKLFWRASGVDYDGTERQLTTSPLYHLKINEAHPGTGLALTPATINAMEGGVLKSV